MADYKNYYKAEAPTPVPTEQLLQLLRIVWDGDLISKTDRDTLVKMGFVERSCGFQIITGEGIRYLNANGLIRA
jgi:hypothetical protein